MNKRDIADIRKHFKAGTDLLKINTIYNVYIQAESSEIFHEVSQPFALLDEEQQDLFFTNFKKVLGGKLGVKLFEVKFVRQSDNEDDNEEHAQKILYDGLQTDDIGNWRENMQRMALKMVQDFHYEKDLVITFIRGNYYKPTKRSKDETDSDIRDEVYSTPFILCSMNQTDLPKRSLVFDFNEKEFKSSITLDPIVNTTSPVGGFLFPCFTDNAADVNHILYAAGKTNKPDHRFIEDVLNGEEIMTAEDNKTVFEEIVKEVMGEEIDSRTLAGVYDEIHNMLMVEEDNKEDGDAIPLLDTKEVERVLKAGGVKEVSTEKVERAFQKIVEDKTYEMNANDVVPSFTSKSIKISTKVADISINPADLRYVRQVTVDGRLCLLIEVEEDAMVEGFKLISEDLVK